MKKIEIHSLQDTEKLAQKLAALTEGRHAILSLDGDLGAGKTTFTKSFGKALGVKRTINSPTFTIMKPYKMGNGKPLYHIDAYRLEGISQDLGFEDCFDEGITVIEWGSFIEDAIPQDHLMIRFEQGTGEERILQVEGMGEESRKLEEALEW